MASFNPRRLWMHHNTPVDAKPPRPWSEIKSQLISHSKGQVKLRLPPAPATIHLGHLTEYEMFDILQHFFTVSSSGTAIQIQWMLLDMQGRIPQ